VILQKGQCRGKEEGHLSSCVIYKVAYWWKRGKAIETKWHVERWKLKKEITKNCNRKAVSISV